jgi:hypothetical protein
MKINLKLIKHIVILLYGNDFLKNPTIIRLLILILQIKAELFLQTNKVVKENDLISYFKFDKNTYTHQISIKSTLNFYHNFLYLFIQVELTTYLNFL